MVKRIGIAGLIIVLSFFTSHVWPFNVKTHNPVLAQQFRNKIKEIAQSTPCSGVVNDLCMFAGIFDLAKAGYKDPILVSAADVVGIKFALAQKIKMHDSIGFDLVANCVNNLLAQGAQPSFFLDYLATGKLDIDEGTQIIMGVAAACRQSRCSLIGAETVELPATYQQGEYDIAGFAVGLVERDQLLPKEIQSGDVLIGLPTNSTHPHTFTTLFQLLKDKGIDITSKPPFASYAESIAQAFLEPATIYVEAVLPLCKEGKIKAIAHTTDGLSTALARSIPDELGVKLDLNSWHLPPMLRWVKHIGGMSDKEMAQTFNLGIGMVLIASPQVSHEILASLKKVGMPAYSIGKITAFPCADQVTVEGSIHSHAIRIMIIGSGAREHALAWKFSQSPHVGLICIAPGNSGISGDPKIKNIPINPTHANALITYAQQNKIDLIVASRAQCVNGFTDQCALKGIRCIGASTAALQLESSPHFAKEFFSRHHIPMAESQNSEQPCSLVIASDGIRCVPLASIQVYTARDNGDKGPQTPGMGAYSPTALTEKIQNRVMKEIVEPVVYNMNQEGIPLNGFLEFRLSIGADAQPRLVDIICDLRDVVAETILARLKTDPYLLTSALADKKLERITVECDVQSALSIEVITKNDENPVAGHVIVGLPQNDDAKKTTLFHGATMLRDGKIITNGERVFCATAFGQGLSKVREAAYALIKNLYWPGIHYRMDIGYNAIAR